MTARPAPSPGAPRVRLVRSARPPLPALELDVSQRAAVEHRGGPICVLGAPGTGVSTTVVEAVVDRVERGGLAPDEVLVLAPTRRAAAELRERISARLDRTIREPIARTPASLAFGVLRAAAALRGEPAPRLLSGPEQDVVLRELLAGHAAGIGRAPDWPAEVRPALRTRGLRTELRDLLMRAVERGLDAQDLARIGAQHGRPEWVAAAEILGEYDEVTALATPGAYDPALIVGAAERTLADDEDVLDLVRRGARFVAVDDAQEMTPAIARLLGLVTGIGGELLLAGDPDAATLGFRGADPGLLSAGAAPYARPNQPSPTLVLGTSWRQGPALRAVTERVAARIGVSAPARLRRPACAAELATGQARAHTLVSPMAEAAYIAGELRRAHLERAIPWGEMAVITRGSSRAATLRRVLAGAGVPVFVPATEQPVRDESAVVPLLDIYTVCLGGSVDASPDGSVGAAGEASLDADTAVRLITSPIGGADAVAVRRLRRALRAEERVGGGTRTSDELLVEALGGPDRVVTLDPRVAAPARRVARVLTAGAEAAAADGANAETVLWAIWSAAGLAEPWRRTALAGGPVGARADRDLDAVVALFDAAARFTDRLPQAGPAEFLEHLRGQEVPGDTLVERAPASDAVALLTPQGAAGREWRLVVVAGVQVGVWPDTRLRGSLLGSQALVDVLAGRGDGSPEALRSAQAAIRHEELRLFHVAVSRASEELVVTAVSGEDEQPSGLLDLVAPAGIDADGEAAVPVDERATTRLERPLSLPALTARLRQVVTGPGADPADPAIAAAASALARLAGAGVPGADPDEWLGLADPSEHRPLVPDGELVPVSPSRVESFEQCGLRWALETSGGKAPDNFAQHVGVLVHELAKDLPDADREQLSAELARRWPQLGLAPGWLTDRQRESAERMIGHLAAYVQSVRRSGRELAGVELDVVVEIGRALVRGRVDRVERTPEGALRIVDLKTGKHAPTEKDAAVNPQLGVYQLAVEAGAFEGGERVSDGGELVMLGSTNQRLTTRTQPPLTAADEPDWARTLLDRVTAGMAAAQFEARQGDQCRTCPLRSSCPVQPQGRAVTG